MKKNHLNEFHLLQDQLKQRKDGLTPIELYSELFKWAGNLAESKAPHAKELYLMYLQGFGEPDMNNYFFEPLWYDFNDLLEFSFFKSKTEKLERVVVVVRDILEEILIYKTDRNCKILPQDNLRLFTDKRQQLFFCCDVCFYAEDVNGIRIQVNERLFPATKQQVLTNSIAPAKP